MAMHNPPHPGEFITDIYLEPNGISGRELAGKLDVAASTLSRILNGASRITPEMALRLAKTIGRSPESWLAMQDAYDLWAARQNVNLQRVGKLKLAATDNSSTPLNGSDLGFMHKVWNWAPASAGATRCPIRHPRPQRRCSRFC